MRYADPLAQAEIDRLRAKLARVEAAVIDASARTGPYHNVLHVFSVRAALEDTAYTDPKESDV